MLTRSTLLVVVSLVGLLLATLGSEPSDQTSEANAARDVKADTDGAHVQGQRMDLIVPELKPQAGDDIIYKTRFSGFFETDLDARLQKLGVTHLIFTGCTTSICVDSTVRDAMFLACA